MVHVGTIGARGGAEFAEGGHGALPDDVKLSWDRTISTRVYKSSHVTCPSHSLVHGRQMTMARRLRQQGSRVALLTLAALSVAACLGPTKIRVSVADFASLFPIVERLSVAVYMDDPYSDCEYFEYGRGAFSSTPADEFCRVFDLPDRPVPVAYDAQALADLAELKKEFNRVGLPMEYINVVFDSAGSVGPDSAFSADPCVTYWYEPGWSALPEDYPGAVSGAIDADWYRTDICP